MGTHSLLPRPKSDDFDIISDSGEVRGQVITSPLGHTVYLIGDVESLLGPHETAEDALRDFEAWAASNPAPDDAPQP